MNSFNSRTNTLNYTQIIELYGQRFNLSPRSHYHDFVRDDWHLLTDAYLLPKTNSIYFIDLEREAEIKVGSQSWKYPQIAADECLITDDFLSDNPNLVVGDKVAYGANYFHLWTNIGNYWNQYIRTEN